MRRTFLNNIYSFFLAALPALSVYILFPGTTLGMFIILVLTLLLVFINVRVQIEKDELRLFIIICFLTLISMLYHTASGAMWFDVTLMTHNLYGIMLCFVPLILGIRMVTPKYFIRYVYFIGLLASLIVIAQRISLITTGSFIKDIFLPWFEIRREVDTMSLDRPSAFFSEPAHLCIYLLPIFYHSLIKRRLFYIGLFLFAILCSGSTTGFIMAGLIMLYNVYESSKGERMYGRLLLTAASISAIFFLIIYLYPQILSENIDKLSLAQQGEGSSSLRLLGPANYLLFFDNFEWLFGITINQLEGFIINNGITEYGRNGNYANAILYMIISYGIIGFSALVYYLVRKWKACRLKKGFLLVFIGILASDQILFNAHFLYLVSFILIGDSIVSCDESTN